MFLAQAVSLRRSMLGQRDDEHRNPCRHGPRHWFRVAPRTQKSGFALLLVPIILLYLLFSSSSDTSEPFSEQLNKKGSSTRGAANSPIFDDTEAKQGSSPWTEWLSAAIHEEALSIQRLEQNALDKLGLAETKQVKKTKEKKESEGVSGKKRRHTDTAEDDLESKTWDEIRRLVKLSAASLQTSDHQAASSDSPSSRFLVVWPTIPVAFKGSDSRALDAITFLTSAGYYVDLMYWHDYADEIDSTYDDTSDRERLVHAGVHRILGPYKEFAPLSRSPTYVANYYSVVTWLWPDMGYLKFLVDSLNHIKRVNGLTHFVPVVDDVGITPRFILSGCNNTDRTIGDVIKYVVAKRPRVLLGKEATGVPTETSDLMPVLDEVNEWTVWESKIFLKIELYLYTLADVTVGINAHAIEYLKTMAPAVPARQLSYVSPVQPSSAFEVPFTSRSGYLFFGYNNFANNAGMEWFAQEVLPYITPDEKLHLAGTVVAPSLCKCSLLDKTDCHPVFPNVVCHGPLTDEKLDALIQSVRVAINPVLEPSGVATKTCRAMAHGTPVVVTDMDGTFDKTRISTGAVRCPRGDARCITDGINEFLTDERRWDSASNAAPGFISKYFGRKRYMHDWMEILEDLASKPIEIVIEGDSSKFGESMTAQNWHIANLLARNDQFHVTVMGKLTPPIKGVDAVKGIAVTSQAPFPGKDDDPSSYPDYERMVASPFETGFQVNIVMRQSWPFTFPRLPLKFCGAGCRVGQILPWEFGSLPAHWMGDIDAGLDWMWAPSEYTRLMYEKSGFDPTHTSVLSAGVDCARLLSTADDKQSNHLTRSEQYKRPVIFFFTGGFLPRKGVDIMLEAWEKTFCSKKKSTSAQFGLDGDKPNVRLLIHTSYELGYSDRQISEMNRIIKKCDGSIEWKRKEWMDDKTHLDLMRAADVYVAPFRSEGFGLPIVESLVLGKSAIIPLGGSPADDYGVPVMATTKIQQKEVLGEDHDAIPPSHHHGIYPLHVAQTECTQYPCEGHQLCVFEPCKNRKCACRDLVSAPTWLKIDPADVGVQMVAAYQDTIKRWSRGEQEPSRPEPHWFSGTSDKHGAVDKGIMGFCFSSLGPTYRDRILETLTSQGRRRITQIMSPEAPEFASASKRKRKRVIRRLLRFASLVASLVALLGAVFVVANCLGIDVFNYAYLKLKLTYSKYTLVHTKSSIE
eukprot:scaffold32101_cov50-Attheya_sp.AAC.5